MTLQSWRYGQGGLLPSWPWTIAQLQTHPLFRLNQDPPEILTLPQTKFDQVGSDTEIGARPEQLNLTEKILGQEWGDLLVSFEKKSLGIALEDLRVAVELIAKLSEKATDIEGRREAE